MQVLPYSGKEPRATEKQPFLHAPRSSKVTICYPYILHSFHRLPVPRATKSIRIAQVSQRHPADNIPSGHTPNSRPADAGARPKPEVVGAHLHVVPTKAPRPFLTPNQDQARRKALSSYILTCKWHSSHRSPTLLNILSLPAAEKVACSAVFSHPPQEVWEANTKAAARGSRVCRKFCQLQGSQEGNLTPLLAPLL